MSCILVFGIDYFCQRAYIHNKMIKIAKLSQPNNKNAKIKSNQVLNSDYYINSHPFNNKIKLGFTNSTKTLRTFSKSKKLFGGVETKIRLIHSPSTDKIDPNRNHCEEFSAKSSRQLTVKRKLGKIQNEPEQLEVGLLQMYSHIEKVLQAYHARIVCLQQKNKLLSRQNSRLRAKSLTYSH